MKLFDKKIIYSELNSRQKETYNFQKISGILADFGYTTIKLSDDWKGADFIAMHFNANDYIKIQLKGRLTFDQKYIGKNIFICFNDQINWYIYPHDLLLQEFIDEIYATSSWNKKGNYSFPYLTLKNKNRLDQYLLS